MSYRRTRISKGTKIRRVLSRSFVITELQNPNETYNKLELKPPQRDWLDKANLIVLILAFIAGAVAAFEGDRLARATVKAIKHSDTAAAIQHTDSDLALEEARDSAAKQITESQAQTNEARRGADASERQVKDAAETSQRQLQAYIGLVAHSLRVVCKACDSLPLTTYKADLGDPNNAISFSLKNFGSTPGQKPWICAEARRVPYGFSIATSMVNELFADCDKLIVKNTQPTIWPGEDRNWLFPIPAPQDIVDARNKIATVFFYGRVRYTDIFNLARNTYFCFIFTRTPAGDDGFRGCGGDNMPYDN